MRKLVYCINGKDYANYTEAKEAVGGQDLNEYVRLDNIPEKPVFVRKVKRVKI